MFNAPDVKLLRHQAQLCDSGKPRRFYWEERSGANRSIQWQSASDKVLALRLACEAGGSPFADQPELRAVYD